MTGHLSEEQISACLIGDAPEADRVHLRGCADCAAELARLAEPLALFRQTIHESALTGVTLNGVIQAPAVKRGWRMAVASAAVAVLLMAAAVPLYQRAEQKREAEQAALQQEIAKQDDALLREVETEVSRSVPPPMQQLELLMVSETSK